jgi:hypothetical protein
MPTCPNCGNNVTEEMSFCPRCGAALKVAQATTGPPPPVRYRSEKGEKHEKREKEEKTEKREKHENGFIGPLIGGAVLIILGLTLWIELMYPIASGILWAFFFVLIGAVIIIGALYGAITAGRRHPKT